MGQIDHSTFPPLKNDLLLRAARGEVTERAPVWVMRQAGRYLPEFRKVRENHEFFEICRTPALATEVTLQPIRRYSGLLDASIIFSDILVIPQAMGLVVEMNPGPYFPDPLKSPDDIARLRDKVDVHKELGYVYEAVTQTRHGLKGECPLIGFVGAPWTLMAYMIESGGGKTLEKAKTWLFRWPEVSHKLLMRIADVCVDHLVEQARAGAQMLQVFDSSAGELSPHDFEAFSLPSLRHIAERVRSILGADAVPMILFARNAHTSLGELARSSGYDVLGISWCIEPGDARRIVDANAPSGQNIALQGNLDPALLHSGRDAIEREVKRMCESFKGGAGKPPQGWIANLGHGITPGVPPDDMKWFLECVRKYSAK